MSNKAVIKPYQVVTNGDMSGDLTSLITDIGTSDEVGYQLVWTGTPTGVFSVQGTIDGVTWSTLDIVDSDDLPPSADGSPGNHIISLSLIPYSKLRVFYDATSGAGTLNVWVIAKRLGG